MKFILRNSFFLPYLLKDVFDYIWITNFDQLWYLKKIYIDIWLILAFKPVLD